MTKADKNKATKAGNKMFFMGPPKADILKPKADKSLGLFATFYGFFAPPGL